MARPRTGTITTTKTHRPRPPLFRTHMLALHRAYLPSNRGRRRRMAMCRPMRARLRARARRCPVHLRHRTTITRPQPRHRTRTTAWLLRCEQTTVVGTTDGGIRDCLGISLEIFACLFRFVVCLGGRYYSAILCTCC